MTIWMKVTDSVQELMQLLLTESEYSIHNAFNVYLAVGRRGQGGLFLERRLGFLRIKTKISNRNPKSDRSRNCKGDPLDLAPKKF